MGPRRRVAIVGRTSAVALFGLLFTHVGSGSPRFLKWTGFDKDEIRSRPSEIAFGEKGDGAA